MMKIEEEKLDWVELKNIIRKAVDQEEVFTDVLGFCSFTKRFKSPFRLDKSPSFGFFRSKDDRNQIFAYDFSLSTSYDIFSAVSEMHGISHAAAIIWIAKQYNVESALKLLKIKINGTEGKNSAKDLFLRYRKMIKKKEEELKEIEKDSVIGIDKISPYSFDLSWGSYRAESFLRRRNPKCVRMEPVNLRLAEALQVYFTPEETSVARDWLRSTDERPIFVWHEVGEFGNVRPVQIYNPYSEKKSNKFRNLANDPFLHKGSSKKFSNTVILSKGYKDSFFIGSMGFNVFHKTGEGKAFSESFKKSLQYQLPKAKHLIILFDSDEAGIKAAERSKKEFLPFFKSVHSMTFDTTKDMDESILKYGYVEARSLLKKKIQNIRKM